MLGQTRLASLLNELQFESEYLKAKTWQIDTLTICLKHRTICKKIKQSIHSFKNVRSILFFLVVLKLLQHSKPVFVLFGAK
jgi:hypothetical protein